MHELFSDPLVFLTVVFLTAGVLAILAHYWWKVRQAELEAALKQEMVRRGMSAREIQQVLAAGPAPEAVQAEAAAQAPDAETPFFRVEVKPIPEGIGDHIERRVRTAVKDFFRHLDRHCNRRC